MPDLDSLLTPEVAARAADAATPPPFEALERRGRARRTTRAALTVAALVAAVAGGAGIVGLHDPGRTEPQPVAPTQTPSPTRPQKAAPTPEQIVDDPDAFVRQVVVMPEDPTARGVVWGLCSDARCRNLSTAIAVTSDGFATRSLIAVRPSESPWMTPAGAAGREGFVVTGGRRPYLLRLDGSRQDVRPPGRAAPWRPDEALARWRGYGDDDFIAVDPVTGASHRVPSPAGLQTLEVSAGGDLEGVVRDDKGRNRLVWSQDGGASWQSHELDSDEASLFTPVPSAVPGLRAVLGGADGATLFPFNDAWRGQDRGSWEAFVEDGDPRAYVGASAVLPDGRLVVDVDGWSDARPGRPGSRPRGPYVSAGDDWSRIERLVPGPDSGLDAHERQQVLDGELEVRGVGVGREHATLYVGPFGQSDVVYSVEDLGQTWSRFRVR